MAQWVKDLALSLLWFRLIAIAWIRFLVWELPHVIGAAKKKKKKNVDSDDGCTVILKTT